MIGENDKALAEIVRASKDDPLNASHYAEAMWLNISMEDYDEAMENHQKAIELDPGNLTAETAYSRLLVKQGKYQAALEQIDIYDNADVVDLLKVHVLALSGKTEKARNLLNATLEKIEFADDFTMIIKNTWIAFSYTSLGEYETALDYLEKAYEEHEMALIFIKDNYEFYPLHDNPRFKTILKKMGLPED